MGKNVLAQYRREWRREEGGGFEPPLPIKVNTISKLSPSGTRPLLQYSLKNEDSLGTNFGEMRQLKSEVRYLCGRR